MNFYLCIVYVHRIHLNCGKVKWSEVETWDWDLYKTRIWPIIVDNRFVTLNIFEWAKSLTVKIFVEQQTELNINVDIPEKEAAPINQVCCHQAFVEQRRIIFLYYGGTIQSRLIRVWPGRVQESSYLLCKNV